MSNAEADSELTSPHANPEHRDADLLAYAGQCRDLVLEKIREVVPSDHGHSGNLYDLMLEYPLRQGKALRPALSIAVCRSLGGSLGSVLPTAAVFELYHNAFLIHDDVEDRSAKRRHEATLNESHGMPTAMNVGDGMLALAMRPLLDNIGIVGLGRSLKVMRLIAEMARETAEGQMLELDWIRTACWTQRDRDYIRLVFKKTVWYTFIAPVVAGAVIAGAESAEVARLARISIPLGVAFQIQDDILNLSSDVAGYGKDFGGDLWEGKHTLILIHALRHADRFERARALEVLRKPRPMVQAESDRLSDDAHALLNELRASREITDAAHRALAAQAKRFGSGSPDQFRNAEDVAFLRELIERHGSIAYAFSVAQQHARRFERELKRAVRKWPASVHQDFLVQLADYVIHRSW